MKPLEMENFFLRENVGVVKIYFRDMGVKESAQEKAYDFLSFLCECYSFVLCMQLLASSLQAIVRFTT